MKYIFDLLLFYSNLKILTKSLVCVYSGLGANIGPMARGQ